MTTNVFGVAEQATMQQPVMLQQIVGANIYEQILNLFVKY